MSGLVAEKFVIAKPTSDPARTSVSVTTSMQPMATTKISRRFQCISCQAARRSSNKPSNAGASLQMKKMRPSATQRMTKSRKNAIKNKI